MWKRLARLAVLVVIVLLPVSAVAHTKLFYRISCRSDYRKVEVMIATPEPMATLDPTGIPIITPLVEIPLESTLSPEPTLTPITTETPTGVPTPTPEVSDQIATPSDISTTPKDLL